MHTCVITLQAMEAVATVQGVKFSTRRPLIIPDDAQDANDCLHLCGFLLLPSMHCVAHVLKRALGADADLLRRHRHAGYSVRSHELQ